MNPLEANIRNAVRAVIIDGDQILMQHKRYEDGSERYALPGGGQDCGETLAVALRRECLEEIGAAVEVAELLHVADWFKQRDKNPPTTRHLVEFLFRCHLPPAYVPHNGHHPDRHQVGVQWVSLARLHGDAIFPSSLLPVLRSVMVAPAPVYLGTL